MIKLLLIEDLSPVVLPYLGTELGVLKQFQVVKSMWVPEEKHN